MSRAMRTERPSSIVAGWGPGFRPAPFRLPPRPFDFFDACGAFSLVGRVIAPSVESSRPSLEVVVGSITSTTVAEHAVSPPYARPDTSIRARRERVGLSREALAAHVGCSLTYLANIEAGVIPQLSRVMPRLEVTLKSLEAERRPKDE